MVASAMSAGAVDAESDAAETVEPPVAETFGVAENIEASGPAVEPAVAETFGPADAVLTETDLGALLELSDAQILEQLTDAPTQLTRQIWKLVADVYANKDLSSNRLLVKQRLDHGDLSSLNFGDMRLRVLLRVRRAIASCIVNRDYPKAANATLQAQDGDMAHELSQVEGLPPEVLASLNKGDAVLQFSPELCVGGATRSHLKIGAKLLLRVYPHHGSKDAVQDVDKTNLWSYIFNTPSASDLKSVFDIAKLLPNGTHDLLDLIFKAKLCPKAEEKLIKMTRQESIDPVFKKWIVENLKGLDEDTQRDLKMHNLGHRKLKSTR